ncbi:hypothetical protein CRUP_029404, partial [Coryphaenoides rupestris]
MDAMDTPGTRRRKAKGMFGLKVKKKKNKGNTDLVLANQGAVVPLEEDYRTEDEVPGVSTTPSPPPLPPTKRCRLNTCIQEGDSKPQSFQVAVNITEARRLVGENIDPSVVIEIGDERKQTSVKEGTNAPFYNEYFVFDFFAHQELFFDKVIRLSVVHSKMLRSFSVGSFKLDVGTVYRQPGHQFANKWAVLTDPGDLSTGVKGYVKCDISVSGKGDAKPPGQKASDAEEVIEKNLLLPEGYPGERPWARFYVRVFRAEGLPRNNSSIMANVTKAFIGDATALIDPYVVVSFFTQTGRTATQKSTADPVWNEQIVFREMFPPLCQRMKIQVWDEGSMNDVAIGTHYFDLRRISNEQDGDKGFLPTFGPAWINLYGSARNFSLGDDNPELNEGIGEGVSYRGRVYLELAVEILAGGTGSEPKLSRLVKPKETKAGKGGGKEAKTPAGGAGGGGGGGADDDKGKAEVLPVAEPPPQLNEEDKESFLLFGCVLEATLIDRKIGDKPISFELSVGTPDSHRRSALTEGTPESSRRKFIAKVESKLKVEQKRSHLTQLDRKRLTLCRQELPQHTIPDVFVWLLSNNKRVAYARLRARDLLFSSNPEERGRDCGKIHTLFLKLDMYLWLGSCSMSGHLLDDLPAGFTPTTEGRDPLGPPTHLVPAGQYEFQLRCHMYQARGLIAADTSGLSDPFARITYVENIQQEPPRIIIEGKAEYLGSTVAVPEVSLRGDRPYSAPQLQYSRLHLGSQDGGELLAAFELLQIPEFGESGLPPLEEVGGVCPVPANIRPVLNTYRLEVFIECAGKVLRSSVIQSYKSNPNFTTLVDAMMLELPENEMLHPPLSISVVDWRAFGRSTLVGNHCINNLTTYKYTAPLPPPASPWRHPLEGTSRHDSEMCSGVAATNHDVTITVEDQAPPTAKTESHKKRHSTRSSKRKKPTIADESAENVIDWWSKYYASVERLQQ